MHTILLIIWQKDFLQTNRNQHVQSKFVLSHQENLQWRQPADYEANSALRSPRCREDYYCTSHCCPIIVVAFLFIESLDWYQQPSLIRPRKEVIKRKYTVIPQSKRTEASWQIRLRIKGKNDEIWSINRYPWNAGIEHPVRLQSAFVGLLM